ncbi:MAG: diaminopropionate ammonia-lyase [Bacilli bacterium]
MNPIAWQMNRLMDRQPSVDLEAFHPTVAQSIQAYHATWPQYQITPLHALSALAERWNLGGIFVKDESLRFGLNAFKGLGGTYAIGRYLSYSQGPNGGPLTAANLKAQRSTMFPLTFATATDGNHGVGVAWAARQLGHEAIVFMPQDTAAARVDAVRAVGGQVEVTSFDYDHTVRWVAAQAQQKGWVLVQDTAWAGYQDIPLWVMQGYMTLLLEALQQLQERGVEKPTHVFLQAGVGSFAAAVTGLLANLYGPDLPIIIIVQPTQTAAFLRTAAIGDGTLYPIEDPLKTIMAGLACGVPNPVAWEILKHWVTVFLSCSDELAARGIRILANPLQGDPPVVSGESGSVTLGVLSSLMENPSHQNLRNIVALNAKSQVLLINTEGMTDPTMYRRIVWDGILPYEV